jgi:hypothetical protein
VVKVLIRSFPERRERKRRGFYPAPEPVDDVAESLLCLSCPSLLWPLIIQIKKFPLHRGSLRKLAQIYSMAGFNGRRFAP